MSKKKTENKLPSKNFTALLQSILYQKNKIIIVIKRTKRKNEKNKTVLVK